jgi:hypothetical protein
VHRQSGNYFEGVGLKIGQEILIDFSPNNAVVKDFAVNPVGYSIAGRAGRPAAGLRPGIEGEKGHAPGRGFNC